MDQPNPLPDINTVKRVADAKRRSGLSKMQHAKHLYQQAQQLEREGAAEIQESEVFERLIKSIPVNQADLLDLEKSETVRYAAANSMEVVFAPDGAKYYVPNGPQLMDRVARTQRDMAAAACFEILRDGSTRPTEELLEELTKRGVVLTAENKLQRLSQILSMNRMFKNQRSKGWSLDISPAGESARNDDSENDHEPDPMRDRARQLARDDGNSAR